jgi:hypothetical protein
MLNEIVRKCPECGRVYTALPALFCVRCRCRTVPQLIAVTKDAPQVVTK